jgi:hypothetical protein
MTRRFLLRLATALAATWPLSSLKVLAIAREQPAILTPGHAATLRAVADVVLPSALTADERLLAVTQFVEWVANYREGADAGHGYGSTRLRSTGASPSSAYPAQLAALEEAARAAGATTLGALGEDSRRAIIETALTSPQRITQLPARPSGQHVVTDFMGQFFHGPVGYNLAYRAAINREDCRGLAGSEQAPPPWPTRQGGH